MRAGDGTGSAQTMSSATARASVERCEHQSMQSRAWESNPMRVVVVIKAHRCTGTSVVVVVVSLVEVLVGVLLPLLMLVLVLVLVPLLKSLSLE